MEGLDHTWQVIRLLVLGGGVDLAADAVAQQVAITVNVEGANGDEHVVKLVQQGVRAGLGQYDKQLDRTISGKIANAQIRQM